MKARSPINHTRHTSSCRCVGYTRSPESLTGVSASGFTRLPPACNWNYLGYTVNVQARHDVALSFFSDTRFCYAPFVEKCVTGRACRADDRRTLFISLSAVITLSPCRPIVRMLGFLYRLPLFIPFIVAAQMMRTFLAKNGLMNNALVATDLFTPLETVSWLGWKGIIITFVWKQLAFATLLICGAMAALEQSQILAARNLGASRPRILFDIILPQVLPAIGVALVLSTVTMMSVLSVPLMIGVGTPTMMTVDMAFRVNSYGDYAVANALGVVSLLICGALSWFYLRHSLQQKGGE